LRIASCSATGTSWSDSIVIGPVGGATLGEAPPLGEAPLVAGGLLAVEPPHAATINASAAAIAARRRYG
jgi:hypothetical protein